MSLRTRLSLLTVGLLLVLLVAGGIFQYFALGQYLFRDEAQVLQQRYAQAIRDLPIRGLAGGAALGAGAKLLPPVVGGHITTAAADCIVRAASGTLVTAVLIDNGGSVVASAPDGVSPPTLALADYSSATQGRTTPYYLTGSGSDESLVVLHSLDTRNGRHLGVVQLSESTSTLRQTQGRLLTILAIATGALMLLAVLLLPLLVRRALAPLRRVTEASAELAGGDFTRRVEEPPTRDELGGRARGFNGRA